MKLKFYKNEQNILQVKILNEDSEKDFIYTNMIKLLCNNNTFDESEFGEGINDLEKQKINNMLAQINTKITEE